MASLTAALTACGNSPQRDYAVAGSLPPFARVDSVSLAIFHDDYHRWIDAGKSPVERGHFSFEGQIDTARLALLIVDGEQLHFYLEPGTTTIDINPDNIIVTGGRANHRFMAEIVKRQRLRREIERNRRDYLRHCADSTLTPDLEREFVRRDSLLRSQSAN
ncbi:MAG: DUF4369 domain-containing protein [Muribaculaceae bacterium]|nr:DUF4369 domain-containing protein [Muribaculaceae bacterium]